MAEPRWLIELTAEGTVAAWSPGAESLLLHTSIEAVGTPFATLAVPPGERGDFDIRLAEAAGRGGTTFAVPLLRRDGARFEAMAALARREQAGGAAFDLNLIDTTSLGTNRVGGLGYSRALVDHMKEGLALCQMVVENGRPDFVYLDVNAAFITLTGLKDVIGKRASDVMPGIHQTDPRLIETYGRVASSGIPERFELFVATLGQWFSVSAFSPTQGQFVALFEVITERKRAEAELQARVEQLRLFVEHAPAAVAMFDTEMRYLVVSRRFVTDLRLTEADLIGRSHYEVFPEIPERWRDIHRRCLAGAVESCEEDPFPRADGQVDWIHWEIRPWYNGAGQIGGVILFSEIITERKLARERLAAEREWLAVTLRSIGDAVIATDSAGRVTLVNGVAETLTGWKEVDAVGRQAGEIFQIVHEYTRLPAISPVDRVLREGQIVELANHVVLIARDGTERPIADSSAPIRDARGTITGVVLVFRDQSRERRTTDALRKTEALLRTFSDSIPDPIYMKDREGRFLFANPATLRLMGKPAEDVLGKRDADIWADASFARSIAAADRRIMESGTAEVTEAAVPSKQGERFYLTSKVPFRDRDGSIVGVVGSSRDITERNRAEEALREREALLSETQRIGHIGTWSFDPRARTLVWSDEAYRIHGVSRDEFVPTPQSLMRFIEPAKQPAIVEWMRACVAGEQPDDLEFPITRPDGSVRVLLARGERVASGETTAHVAGTFQDVTERRHAEHRFEALLENSTDLIVVLDAQRRIVFCSSSAAEELGRSPAEVLALGERGMELVHPDDRAASAEIFASLGAAPGSVRRFERRHLHKNGSIRLVEVTARNLLKDPAVKGVIVNVHDVTTRRQLEDQLRQSQKMEAVGRLAGGVAHDFNNLLSVILSYASLLLKDTRAGDPIQDDLQQILTAGQRATDLTRQLLMFSRQQVLEPRVIDLNTVLSEMDRMLQRVLGADVDLLSIPSPDLGRVRVDPNCVEQVIMNLVVNARDAMPMGGKLTMETANVTLDESYAASHLGVKAGPHVMLAVTDSGAGMDKATQARIFEPFFTTKERGKGTGLGLSTVFGIVQQSGGSIWVYSEPGQGTTFKVFLPRVDAFPDPVHSVTPAPATLPATETLLLVDDDDQLRIVASSMLRRNGYRVIEARNAGEALLHAEQHVGTIHLLVTDVVMPQMSGPELATRLARVRPEMKILCMSGYTEDSVVRHGVLTSQIAFLQKPITPESLAAKVRDVLNSDSPAGFPGA